MIFFSKLFLLTNRLLLFVLLILLASPCRTAGEELLYKIEEATIKAIVEKVKPLIEETTGRNFKKNVNFKIVKRLEARDAIIADANILVYRKLMPTANDDEISRQIESVATATSQILLGLYVPQQKQLLILPQNVESIVKAYAIGEDIFQDFVFLLVTHEMVHMLDDQYFNLREMQEGAKDLEALQAYACLVEGNAVYVTNRIAENLEIPGEANSLAIKSAAGVMDMSTRVQMQANYQTYILGAEFVTAIVEAKGSSGVSQAFASPPVSTRQIMNPEAYLNPSSVNFLDCSWLLEDIPEKLPMDGMTTQSIDMGTFALNSSLIAVGISEEEASSVSGECLSAAVFLASKQTLKTKLAATIMAVDFANRESAEKMLVLSQKAEQSQEAQFNARLNASITVVEDRALLLDGYDPLRYRLLEKKVNHGATTELSVEGLMDSTYLSANFVNMDEDITQEVIEEVFNSLYQKNEHRTSNVQRPAPNRKQKEGE